VPGRSPLAPLHTASGASWTRVDGWEVPWAWTTPLQEAEGARQGVALWDRAPWGRLLATGRDALDLLHRLSTNRLDDLPIGKGRTTVLTTGKGRCVDWIWVFRLPRGVLLLTGPDADGEVASWVETYTILEDVALTSLMETTTLIGVVGPRGEDLLKGVVGLPEGMGVGEAWEGSWGDSPLLALRTDALALPQWDLLMPAQEAPTLWDALRQRGAAPMGEGAVEVLRIAAGVPRRGKEITPAYNPLEAGLWESISFTKGCYIGQEVLARLKTYGRLQKALARLTLEEPAPEGSGLWAEGRRVGTVTSCAVDVRGPVALGYLARPFLEVGRQVEARGPEGRAIPAWVVWAPSLPPVYQPPQEFEEES